MLHLYAALAEKERSLISQRTRSALSAKKAQGVNLGDPRAAEAAAKSHVAIEAADQFAANVLPIVREIQAFELTKLRDIAGALNARGIRTARGGAWYQSTVPEPAAAKGLEYRQGLGICALSNLRHLSCFPMPRCALIECPEN